MKSAIWLLTLVLSSATLRAGECEDNNIRIVEVMDGPTRKLVAKGDNCMYATITLTVTLDNMTASQRFPLIVDLNGTNSLTLVSLQQDKPHQSWHYHYHFDWRPGGRSGATGSYHIAPP